LEPKKVLVAKGMRRISGDVVAMSEESSTQSGFTVVELLVTLILFTIAMALGSSVFSGYQSRTAAQRAAQVFAMDLSLARTSAVRGREVVIVDFDEAGGSYVIRLESGDTILRREFGRDDDIPLDSLNLQLTGDSLAFDSRGVGDLSGSASPLGTASFAAGANIYDVSFNVMGASKVDPR
jgi:prepilin-type N-terminal cleavage/methylation domain-containing protein